MDPWLDGILRFGGGYSNWLANDTSQRGQVFTYVKNYASAVEQLNAGSGAPSTCVFVPPPQQGLGCKCVQSPCQWPANLQLAACVQGGYGKAACLPVCVLFCRTCCVPDLQFDWRHLPHARTGTCLSTWTRAACPGPACRASPPM